MPLGRARVTIHEAYCNEVYNQNATLEVLFLITFYSQNGQDSRMKWLKARQDLKAVCFARLLDLT